VAGVRSKTSGSDHNVMRELNRSLVLDLLKQHSPISRAAIAKAAGLAKPTVSAIMDELIQKGLVREIGIGETTTGGGRPPIMLEFNARSQFVVGVQVGVGRVQVVLADARGAEVGRIEESTPKGTAAEVLKLIADLVKRALDEAEVPKARLSALGICIPGLIDFDSGVCLMAPNLKWRDVAVGPILTKALGVPVFVHNTSQAAAVAESIEGAGQDVENLVFLFVGSGIGAGILSEGRLFHGTTGIAGEVGHCPVPGATERCNCGKVGCLETVASGSAVAKAARKAVAAGAASTLADRGNRITAEDVGKAAAEGDALAIEILATAGEAIGLAASWLINILNPDRVVVGGGLSLSGELLLGPLRDSVKTQALPQSADRVDIVLSTADDARVRGAVLLALQNSEQYYRVIFQG
jgi:N-acetylglucosamine repressor